MRVTEFKSRWVRQWAWMVLLILAGSAWADSAEVERAADEVGQVQIPLELYNQLMERMRQPLEIDRPAPARYALGQASVNVRVPGSEVPRAEVQTQLSIDVLEDGWSLVPVLPVGTAVAKVQVDGAPVQLMATPGGLAWGVERRGSYKMELTYRIDAGGSSEGWTLTVPTPEAASIGLRASWAVQGLDAAVIPSAGSTVSSSGSGTVLNATIPTTRGVQITWRLPGGDGHTLSRAVYRGSLVGEAVAWTGTLHVELWDDGPVTLPLLYDHLTLSEVLVDGKEAPILMEQDCFATLVRGSGRHEVELHFEVPVDRSSGPPKITMDMLEVPVSRFELTLPGKKDVAVEPASYVAHTLRQDSTLATVNVSLSSEVSMSWTEAVPDDVQAEVRANAGVFHLAHAEEGVLMVRALVDYEVSRGETTQLSFSVPPEVQVNRVEEASGAVADWRLSRVDGGQEVRVFLNRPLQGRLQLDIAYDRALAQSKRQGSEEGESASPFQVPLLQAMDTQRQRGMVALLQGQDLTLEPVNEGGATSVGENQLPAFVRQLSDLTVAHTFKYVETPPSLEARAATPERQQGRFDARIDTLLSLGEVTLKGAASIEIDVKSGHIMELDLGLPQGANLLSLSGPSLRDHEVQTEDDGTQRVHVEFTQDMAGQFRLEAAFERLLADDEQLIDVPTLGVRGAEVEQGRLALEALSAVEVGVDAAEQLTVLDMGELPQQLVLRTTNPILMAYKYVSPPYRLALRITHHDLVDVQEAAIDDARYSTLFTRDGLTVTTARFQMRNSREQFLRVKLPEGARVWSAFVDGRPVKPAVASDDDGDWHLIKIIHSTQGFPVELIYQTEGDPVGGLGTVDGQLPRPETLVTRTRWDVYVPQGVRYGRPSGELDVVASGQAVSAADMQAEMAGLSSDGERGGMEPLRLVVPTAGVHYAFEKLYANQGDRDAGFVLPYASGSGRTLGMLGLLLGMAALGGGGWCWRQGHRRWGALLIFGGLLLMTVLRARYQLSVTPLWVLGLAALVIYGGYRSWLWRAGSRVAAVGDG